MVLPTFGGESMRIGLRVRWLMLLVVAATMAAVAALPALAYRYPLSSNSIHEAYLLGAATNGENEDFVAPYTHTLPALKVQMYLSDVKIETPFFQVAEHARETKNYTAQDAIEEFLPHPPALFLVQLDICRGHKETQPVKFRITQNDRELTPSSVERTPYYAAQRHGPSLIIGDHVKLEFEADKIESAPLTVEIETPEGQHAETTFDLSKLR